MRYHFCQESISKLLFRALLRVFLSDSFFLCLRSCCLFTFCRSLRFLFRLCCRSLYLCLLLTFLGNKAHFRSCRRTAFLSGACALFYGSAFFLCFRSHSFSSCFALFRLFRSSVLHFRAFHCFVLCILLAL